jgi:hypothetical protein
LKNKPIKIGVCTSLNIFIVSRFEKIGCCLAEAQTPMARLFRRGEELIDKEMDMIKIIKAIRNLKVVLKSRIIDKATMFQIKNSGKNVINIDKESSEDSSVSSESDD